jgi:hypothetical protein
VEDSSGAILKVGRRILPLENQNISSRMKKSGGENERNLEKKAWGKRLTAG